MSCVGTAKLQLARESYGEGIAFRNKANDEQALLSFKRTVSYLKTMERNQSLPPEGTLLLGNCYVYLNDIAGARKQYWSILQNIDARETDPETEGLTLLGLGQTYENEGYPDIALVWYETVLNNAKLRTDSTHPEAGIRWASLSLIRAESNRDSTGSDEWAKTVKSIIKKLNSIVYKYPSHAGLRQILGNAYYSLSEGENREYLEAALAQVIIALDTPQKPVILYRVLMDDFSTISQNILETIENPDSRELFRRHYLGLSSRWSPN